MRLLAVLAVTLLAGAGGAAGQKFPFQRHVCDPLVEGCCAPQVVIIGAMKCGTNAIMSYLSKHPAFRSAVKVSEVHFFSYPVRPGDHDHNSPEGRRAYASNLPCNGPGSGAWTVDKSPSYINDPTIPPKVHAMMPNAKILAVLCNPADRLWKEWWHNLRHLDRQRCQDVTRDLGYARLAFEREIRARLDRYREDPDDEMAHGRYGDHMKAWIDTFGKENVMAVDSGMMEEETEEVVLKVLDFLGVDSTLYPPQHQRMAAVYRSEHPDLHLKAWEWMRDFYLADSSKLADLIGEEWPREWSRKKPSADDVEEQERLLRLACALPTNGLNMDIFMHTGPLHTGPVSPMGRL